MFLVWVGDGTDCYIDPKFFFNHSSTSFSSWLGCSTVDHWGPQSPQSASWFSRLHPLFNWLKPSVHLVILLFNDHLLPLFFRLFIQVHLLIDSSVEDQNITLFLYYKDTSMETHSPDNEQFPIQHLLFKWQVVQIDHWNIANIQKEFTTNSELM